MPSVFSEGFRQENGNMLNGFLEESDDEEALSEEFGMPNENEINNDGENPSSSNEEKETGPEDDDALKDRSEVEAGSSNAQKVNGITAEDLLVNYIYLYWSLFPL